LTKKQAECAAYLAAGITAKKTAKALGISFRTVESYINNIKEKIFQITNTKPTKEELIKFIKESGIHDAVFPFKIESEK